MTRKGYQIHDQDAFYFMTMTMVGWVDIFTYRRYKDIVIENFQFYSNQGLSINAYVIMSNHIHLICHAKEGGKTLSELIRDLKKMIAKQCLSESQKLQESRRAWLKVVFEYFGKLNSKNKIYQFWQHGNRPIELWSPRITNQKINYMHLNPVRIGLVDEPHHYVYSSASNYLTGKGVFEVEILDV